MVWCTTMKWRRKQTSHRKVKIMVYWKYVQTTCFGFAGKKSLNGWVLPHFWKLRFPHSLTLVSDYEYLWQAHTTEYIVYYIITHIFTNNIHVKGHICNVPKLEGILWHHRQHAKLSWPIAFDGRGAVLQHYSQCTLHKSDLGSALYRVKAQYGLIINIGAFWTVWSQHVWACVCVWSVRSLKQTCPPPSPLYSGWKLICVIESPLACFHTLPIQTSEKGGWSNIVAVMIQSQVCVSPFG